VGFVLRADLLLAKARGNADSTLANYSRELIGVHDRLSLLEAFDLFLSNRAHMMYVVNEYGVLKGLVTMEDLFETLTGSEIVDESDTNVDMQQVARRKWRKRAEQMGLNLEEFEGGDEQP